MHVATPDTARTPYRMSGGFKAFLWLLAALLIFPAVLWIGLHVGLYVVITGGAALDDFAQSGSVRGAEALERARNALQDLDGDRWRVVATDAWAGWNAPDMGGDQTENYAFTLPPAEIPPFQAALDAKWTRRTVAGSDPEDREVRYEYEGASLTLNRETGRVLIHWANFYSLTPTTKPAGRAAGQRPTSGPKTAISHE